MPAIVFDLSDREIGFATSSDAGNGVYLDIENDDLYFTDGTTTYKFDDDTANPKLINYRSRMIRTGKLVNLGAARIEAETYDDLTFKLYAEIGGVMRLKHTQTVTDDSPFRLPGGYLSGQYQIQLETTDEIIDVTVAETVFELAEG